MCTTSLPIRRKDHSDERKTTKKLHLCKNNWVRITPGMKKIDKRRTKELRKEVGVRESLTGKLVRSWLKWAGHVEILEGKRLKRVDWLSVEGGMRRGK